MEDIDWNTHIDANLTGTGMPCALLLPILSNAGSGRITRHDFYAGTPTGTKYGAAYSASKGEL